MPRRKRKVASREIAPDSRYQSLVVQKFINMVMKCGKKGVARSIVYGAMEKIAAKNNFDSEKTLSFFEKAVEQVRPQIEVRSRRVGGGVYQIPTEVRGARAMALALRWIIDAASKRSDKTMCDRVASELLDAVEGHGNAVKKKVDVHKMAEANRAFSHYAW